MKVVTQNSVLIYYPFSTTVEHISSNGCYFGVGAIFVQVIINPRHACAERVTVVVLCVCVYVCLSRTRYSGSTRD